MKILILTALWPQNDDTDRTETTHAVKELVQCWGDTSEVLVCSLVRQKMTSFRWFQSLKSFSEQNYQRAELPTLPEFPGGRSLVFPTVHKLSGYLKNRNFIPNLVVAHFRTAHLLIPGLKKVFPKTFFVSGVHQFDVRRVKSHTAYEKAFEKTDLLAFRSEPLRLEVLKQHPEWKEKSILALSGVPAHLIKSDSRWVEGSGLPKRLVYVGRLIPRKNVDLIIRAVSELKQDSWTLMVVGEGPQGDELKQLVQQLNLTDRVTFAGKIPHEEVFARLDDSSVFVMPSLNETFGLAYLEAMARGCLVIGTKGTGVDGVVEDRRNGFLVRPGDLNDLVEKLNLIAKLSLREYEEMITQGKITIHQMTLEERSKGYLKEIMEKMPGPSMS